jgi:hypothetical protein
MDQWTLDAARRVVSGVALTVRVPHGSEMHDLTAARAEMAKTMAGLKERFQAEAATWKQYAARAEQLRQAQHERARWADESAKLGAEVTAQLVLGCDPTEAEDKQAHAEARVRMIDARLAVLPRLLSEARAACEQAWNQVSIAEILKLRQAAEARQAEAVAALGKVIAAAGAELYAAVVMTTDALELYSTRGWCDGGLAQLPQA